VIPAVIGLVAVVMVVQRKWRIAAYVLFCVAVSQRRIAPRRCSWASPARGQRLESLPVTSYPSGHTAASIALYSDSRSC
jgi:hypothetical protein